MARHQELQISNLHHHLLLLDNLINLLLLSLILKMMHMQQVLHLQILIGVKSKQKILIFLAEQKMKVLQTWKAQASLLADQEDLVGQDLLDLTNLS